MSQMLMFSSSSSTAMDPHLYPHQNPQNRNRNLILMMTFLRPSRPSRIYNHRNRAPIPYRMLSWYQRPALPQRQLDHPLAGRRELQVTCVLRQHHHRHPCPQPRLGNKCRRRRERLLQKNIANPRQSLHHESASCRSLNQKISIQEMLLRSNGHRCHPLHRVAQRIAYTAHYKEETQMRRKYHQAMGSWQRTSPTQPKTRREHSLRYTDASRT